MLPLALDVTDRASVDAAVEAARDRFGRIDIVVNNAGYGLFGAVEDVNEDQARAQMETNFSERSGSPRRFCPCCANRAEDTYSRSPA